MLSLASEAELKNHDSSLKGWNNCIGIKCIFFSLVDKFNQTSIFVYNIHTHVKLSMAYIIKMFFPNLSFLISWKLLFLFYFLEQEK